MTDAEPNMPDPGDTPSERPEASGADSGMPDPAAVSTRDSTNPERAGSGSATPAAARGRGRGRGPGSKLALIVAIISLAMAGYVLWQYREFHVALDRADERLADGIEDARASARRVSDAVEDLRGEITTRDVDVSRLEDDLETVPAQIRALERRIETLQGGQGGRFDVRDEWLRAQAEYYLEVANTELRLGGRWDNAIEALELADNVLRTLGDPALGDVRSAIAEELQSLRAIDWPDVDRIASDLNGLTERLPELPMRTDSPREYASEPAALEEAEPGLGRLWQSLKGAVSGVIRVERRDAPVDQVLTESERELVRRHLALELQIARAAVVEQREPDFRASLAAAGRMLERDFNGDDARVSEARRLLEQLARIDLVPPKPDISDSLMLLKAAPGAD
jgi:uroporphyrin-III C-methyltransferase